MYPETFLKISIKLLTSPFSVMVQTFFIRRALKRHLGTTTTLQGQSEGTCSHLFIHSAFTRLLKHLRDSGTGRALGRSGAQGT